MKFTKHSFEQRGERFIVNWHHEEIAEHLRAVERGEINNLLINCPPRYTKTELVGINWPAQSIGRHPRAKFIFLSYSDDLALDGSGKVKETIESEWFQELWPVKLKPDSKSKKKWYTTYDGGVYATAAGGPITGFGAGATVEDDDKFYGAIIIDDPLKPDDARSAVERAKVNERLNNTIKSRRNSRNTPIVIIMQRLHEDDMSGYVMEGGMGEEFYHLKLKALDNGKALWDLKHSVKELEEMQLKDRVNFATQYQQEPAPLEGNIVKLEWFARYKALPEEPTMIVHSWDTAYKANQHNDPSVLTVWHVTPTLYYLAEVHRGKWEYPELKHRAYSLADEQKPHAILIEDKASGQTLLQEMRSDTKHTVIPIKPDADKETRARAEVAAIEAGRVALPEIAAWLGDYEQEMLLFPNAKNDDQMDSTSQFLRWMRQRGAGDVSFNELMDDIYG